MAITQRFKLSLIPNSSPVVIHVNQYDTGEGRFVICENIPKLRIIQKRIHWHNKWLQVPQWYMHRHIRRL